ncbi:MAG: phosphatidate cytidylyltransferase, partial [Fuerstiella sp.]|nr:phosphatidate cytidylyltransferase [Fuerstiella sp.]
MLGWRLGISVVLVPSLLLLFWWDSTLGHRAPALLVFCLLISIRSTFEMSQLLKTRAMKPSFELTALCNVLVIFAAWAHSQTITKIAPQQELLISLGWIAAAIVGSFVLLMLFEAARFRKPGGSLESLGANSITLLYAGGLLAVIAQFRWFPNESIGYFAIGSVIIAAKSGDIMAYTFGRLCGRRKMVPRLSPGKTWMGGFGALVGSGLGGWLWLTFGGQLFEARPTASRLECVLAYSVTMGVFGV